MNATGNLRVKRGIWQMVFEYQDDTGKRRQKSESTGLPEKGNKMMLWPIKSDPIHYPSTS